eukprot:SAG11_NODE_6162_length_1373_cov_4.374411_1_plen_26_part_10
MHTGLVEYRLFRDFDSKVKKLKHGFY